jgi:1-acyl-sn-glycerol-3-phosphate acyltransferase
MSRAGQLCRAGITLLSPRVLHARWPEACPCFAAFAAHTAAKPNMAIVMRTNQMNSFLPGHDAFKSEEEGAALRPGQPAARGVFSRFVLRTLNVEVAVRPSTQARLVAGGCLVACNHVSFLDGILLALASPVPLSITCEPLYARRTWRSRALFGVLSRLGFGTVLALGPESPLGIRGVLRSLANGSSVVVFPEGRISPDGAPLPAMAGFSWLKRRTSRLIHVRIEGAHRSRLFGKKGDQWWPRIRVIF